MSLCGRTWNIKFCDFIPQTVWRFSLPMNSAIIDRHLISLFCRKSFQRMYSNFFPASIRCYFSFINKWVRFSKQKKKHGLVLLRSNFKSIPQTGKVFIARDLKFRVGISTCILKITKKGYPHSAFPARMDWSVKTRGKK